MYTARLAILLVLHAASAGLASVALVTRPVTEWMPVDNQTVYRLAPGERRSLQLNTTSILRSTVYITISPCSRDVNWAFYQGKSLVREDQLSPLKEHSSEESTFSLTVSQNYKYLLQLSSEKGGAVAVSIRGEAASAGRLKLRIRSRRRLSAYWDSSPVDPHLTSYCVVASHRKNYTSLCGAQWDLTNHSDKPSRYATEGPRLIPETARDSSENNVDDLDVFDVYGGNMKNLYRKRKFSRSTKVTDEDPVIACVGERLHHLIENMDPLKTYYVSVFGVASDRRAGSLLASGSVRSRTSTAIRLKENLPHKADVRNRSVFYFKALPNTAGGIWLTVTTCGGAVDVEVLVKGKRLHMAKNIDPHTKMFIPAPMQAASVQDLSDESSVQFDSSSSEETKIRYVIKVVPSRWETDGTVKVELTASTTRWGSKSPELSEDGAAVRELRPRRSCRSVDIAFLPAHAPTDVIQYCITTRETNGETNLCTASRKSRTQCTNHVYQSQTKAIVQKISGLRPGRKYAIQVIASSRGSSVPYNVCYADTNLSCRNGQLN